MPFAAAVDAGVAAVMTSHIVVPALDPDLPATLSPPVLVAAARASSASTASIVSDALDMAGASGGRGIPRGRGASRWSPVPTCSASGADKDAALVREVQAAVVAAVRSGRLPEERLVDAAHRIAGLEPDHARPAPRLLDVAEAMMSGPRVREAVERAAVTGEIDLTYRVQLPDDSPRWIRIRGERQPSNDWLMGTFTDITREVQLEAARSSSEARLQVIFSESGSPMFVFGPGIRLEQVNDAFARTLGRDRSELLGKRLEALVQADDVARVRELTEQLTVGTDVAMPACTLVAKRGRSVRCSMRLWVDGGTGSSLTGIGVVYVEQRSGARVHG